MKVRKPKKRCAVYRSRVGKLMQRIRNIAGITLEEHAKQLRCGAHNAYSIEHIHIKNNNLYSKRLKEAYGFSDEQSFYYDEYRKKDECDFFDYKNHKRKEERNRTFILKKIDENKNFIPCVVDNFVGFTFEKNGSEQKELIKCGEVKREEVTMDESVDISLKKNNSKKKNFKKIVACEKSLLREKDICNCIVGGTRPFHFLKFGNFYCRVFIREDKTDSFNGGGAISELIKFAASSAVVCFDSFVEKSEYLLNYKRFKNKFESGVEIECDSVKKYRLIQSDDNVIFVCDVKEEDYPKILIVNKNGTLGFLSDDSTLCIFSDRAKETRNEEGGFRPLLDSLLEQTHLSLYLCKNIGGVLDIVCRKDAGGNWRKF